MLEIPREQKKVPIFEHFPRLSPYFYCYKDIPSLFPLIKTGYQSQSFLTTYAIYPCFKQRQRFCLRYISLQFLWTLKRCPLEVEHGHIGFQNCRYPVLLHPSRCLKEHPGMCFPVIIGDVLIQIPEHCPAVHVVTVDGQISRFSQNTVCLEEQTSIDVVVSPVIPRQIILRFFRAALQYRIIDATLLDRKPAPNIRDASPPQG